MCCGHRRVRREKKAMPSLKNSAVELNKARYDRVMPTAAVGAQQLPLGPPAYFTRSTVFITSLPAISSNLDALTRQFYGTRLPVRRLSV
jgi:hypothetical protein